MHRGVKIAAGVLILWCLNSGCGDSDCAGFERTPTSNAPWISEVRLASQLSGDPWTAIFGVSFEDIDGDLATTSLGKAEFFLDGNSAASVELDTLFAQSSLEKNARTGEIAIPLRFSENISDGASTVLGLQLADNQKNRSNCYSLELDFAVSTALSN